ncbi:M15 family metallopeptidase [Serratia proteamaculans]|jgi:LAS superfamily LD-carboxypeptidase LdcB|uniref:M15 family metallopeptidase n=1 Tax=Serratia proteamaculans TaxID=28151 RepID=A0A7U0N3L0_SERPR|nr:MULTISPECIES: M15 family metallopeptidase [Serratia]MBO1505331.1 M15 family metallopeptidase [Serratia proteamaculans]MDW5511642.1 M15 family metallopeptidase [Serratia proteamaculans]QQX51906.1 M15 family metallopeptidase [Serratia proteamaculans]WEO88311.1 M15 family metallopeptidase [Serratia proteamaculans]CAI1869632.1 D-alanyl-D-alanine carboxypeptidase [Serratia proteamaculans]
MITPEMLTGRSTDHLVPLCGNHRLQPAAVAAFLAMQQAALAAGFDLQPASTFRDFDRQQAIWNGKFCGQRPVLDKDSRPIDITPLSAAERCEAILRWSALPGASRHHWGSDLDVYDPSLLPAGQKLQLEPWEYQHGGYFYPLNQWMTAHMAEFGFYRPFTEEGDGVAVEPWHLSYRPLAREAEHLLTPALLLAAWKNKDVAGAQWLEEHLPSIFSRFIRPEGKE